MIQKVFFAFFLFTMGLMFTACNPALPVIPQVTLTASSTQVTSAGTVQLAATTPANWMPIKVEFYEGANKLAEDTTQPFEHILNYTSQNNGEHTYTAKALGVENQQANSTPVKVNVNVPVSSGISSVVVMANFTTLLTGESTLLKAVVSGTGPFNPEVIWSIEEGEGQLSATSGAEVTFAATSNAGQVKVRATSVQDPTKTHAWTFTVIDVDQQGVLISGPQTMMAETPVRLSAFPQLLGSDNRNVNWTLLRGTGTLTPSTSGRQATFSAPAGFTGQVILLASSVRDPSLKGVLNITVKPKTEVLRHQMVSPGSAILELFHTPSTARDNTPVIVAVESTYQISHVTARLVDTGFTQQLTYQADAYHLWGNSTPKPGYVGDLPFAGLSEGEHLIEITTTDVQGTTLQDTYRFVLNRPPKLTVPNLDTNAVIADPDGTYRLQASCDDQGRPCEVVLYNTREDKRFEVLLRGNGSMDVTLQIATMSPPCVDLEAMDLLGDMEEFMPGMEEGYLCILQIPDVLQVEGKVTGQVKDFDATRVLALNTLNDRSLSLYQNFNQFQRLLAPGANFPVLYDQGGIYFKASSSGGWDVYDTQKGDVPIITSAKSLANVGQDMIVWKDRTESGYHSKLSVFNPVQLGAFDVGDFSVQGDTFVYRKQGNINLLKEGEVQQITQTNDSAGRPQTDGMRVLYIKTSAPAGLYLFENGQEALVSSLPAPTLDPIFGMNNGHVAYMENDATGQTQVWVRQMDGTKKQVTFFSQSSTLLRIGDDGRVAILSNNRIYVQDASGQWIDTGLPYAFVGSIKFINGNWFFGYLNAVLELK